jgi:putative membrane protein
MGAAKAASSGILGFFAGPGVYSFGGFPHYKRWGRMQRNTPFFLLAIYILVFVVCAISPHDRSVWWAENIPIVLIVAANIVIYKYYRFTPVSYLLMSFLIIIHTIGGHYTFALVPFDLVTNLFGFTRNHYDRLGHFSVGLYAYPVAEFILVRKLVRSRWLLFLLPIFTIFTVAATYEIFEWLYAVSADPTAGIAVLGSQGDVWDAQKDMLTDGLGALFAMTIFYLVCRRRLVWRNVQG